MERVTAFNELMSLLFEAQITESDSPLLKNEGDAFIFVQKNKRVNKSEKFSIRLNQNDDQGVEYTAEQIINTFRTRNLPLSKYLANVKMAKLSTVHRPLFVTLLGKGPQTFFQQVNAQTVSLTQQTSSSSTAQAQEESGQRKRERDDDRTTRQETKQSRHGPKVFQNLADVVKSQVRYFDRNSALNAMKSFQEVIDMDNKSKNVEEEHNKKGAKQKAVKNLGSPIIVVPPNATAVLNIYNIKMFLEDMYYMPAEEVRKKNPSEPKPEFVYVTRRKHSQAGDIRFKVVDSVVNFDDATWDRVVAVFVSGQAWQMKGWKWPTPADIFARVKGLYVYFDDAKLSDQIKGWNVSALPIKHQSRNKDIVQVHEIWRQVDYHMERHQPLLLRGLIDKHEASLRAEKEARQKGMQAQLEDDDEEDEIVGEDLNNSQMLDA